MQKDKNNIAIFKKIFEDMAELGLNPACASMTTSDFDDEEYQRYVKSRLRVIKRGEDLMYQFKEVVSFVIEKIKK